MSPKPKCHQKENFTRNKYQKNVILTMSGFVMTQILPNPSVKKQTSKYKLKSKCH